MTDLPEMLALVLCARDVIDRSMAPTPDVDTNGLVLVRSADLNRMHRALAFIMPGDPGEIDCACLRNGMDPRTTEGLRCAHAKKHREALDV